MLQGFKASHIYAQLHGSVNAELPQWLFNNIADF
jgi:hypothetical protein